MSNATTASGSSARTIGQGLRLVKKLKGLIAEATQRATASSSWVAGRKPTFDFTEQRTKRGVMQNELVRVEAAIARANATATITTGGVTMTLARAIRELQEIKADLAWLPSLSLRSGLEEKVEHEYDEEKGRNVLRTKSTTFEAVMSEPDRVVQVQALRDRFEAINDALETANHRTEIEVDPK